MRQRRALEIGETMAASAIEAERAQQDAQLVADDAARARGEAARPPPLQHAEDKSLAAAAARWQAAVLEDSARELARAAELRDAERGVEQAEAAALAATAAEWQATALEGAARELALEVRLREAERSALAERAAAERSAAAAASLADECRELRGALGAAAHSEPAKTLACTEASERARLRVARAEGRAAFLASAEGEQYARELDEAKRALAAERAAREQLAREVQSLRSRRASVAAHRTAVLARARVARLRVALACGARTQLVRALATWRACAHLAAPRPAAALGAAAGLVADFGLASLQNRGREVSGRQDDVAFWVARALARSHAEREELRTEALQLERAASTAAVALDAERRRADALAAQLLAARVAAGEALRAASAKTDSESTREQMSLPEVGRREQLLPSDPGR